VTPGRTAVHSSEAQDQETSMKERSFSILRHLLAASLSGGVLLAAGAASANDFLVNNAADTHDATLSDGICRDAAGKCTLRAAIEQANAHPGWDSITLGSFTHVLTKALGELLITEDVDLYGLSSSATVIDGNFVTRVFRIADTVQDGLVYMSDLTIKNGLGATSQSGVGIRIEAGDVNGDRIVVTNNKSPSSPGGGVAAGDTFLCYDCEISANETKLDLLNGVNYSGGGLFLFSGASAYIYYSTFSNNKATRGGGIAGGGHLELWNSTVSGNSAVIGGGGLNSMMDNAQWAVAYTTITNNTANTGGTGSSLAVGGGFFHRFGSFEIGRSIVAGNKDNRPFTDGYYSPDCASATTAFIVLSHWDNLFGDIGNQCYIKSVFGGSITGLDQYGSPGSPIDPKLEALATFPGSYTKTHALKAGSPARNKVTHTNPTGWWLMDCPTLDQTNMHARPLGGLCDVGSFEAP
jgi:predicted outer membrane repeat protein